MKKTAGELCGKETYSAKTMVKKTCEVSGV